MPKTAPNFDLATRASVVTSKAPAGGGLPSTQIEKITGVPISTINRIYARAVARSFKPDQRPLYIRDAYVEDAPRAGRPSKRSSAVISAISEAIRTDRFSRKKTCNTLAYELQQRGVRISATTV
ncbi:hypothetical protein GQ44DRAFT_808030 [Phaeosphaeriaceae sp. PMI808]|nr:hypothetical protein GQ44DRAFT_808030 [Phaeosphaeriaceae sp. PMI808]